VGESAVAALSSHSKPWQMFECWPKPCDPDHSFRRPTLRSATGTAQRAIPTNRVDMPGRAGGRI